MAGNTQFSTLKVDKDEVYAQGTFKVVFRAQCIEGPKKGLPYVVKYFKPRPMSFGDQLNNELRVVEAAKRIAKSWNQSIHSKGLPYLVFFIIPKVVVEDGDEGLTCLLEPLIQGYKKYNNNDGWASSSHDLWNEALQALSHFSFHATHGKIVLCDIQGGLSTKGYILTDPALLSTTVGKYGPADLGWQGIEKFFEGHRCTQFCKPHWLKPATLRDGRTVNAEPRWKQPAPHVEVRGKDDPRWKRPA